MTFLLNHLNTSRPFVTLFFIVIVNLYLSVFAIILAKMHLRVLVHYIIFVQNKKKNF